MDGLFGLVLFFFEAAGADPQKGKELFHETVDNKAWQNDRILFRRVCFSGFQLCFWFFFFCHVTLDILQLLPSAILS